MKKATFAALIIYETMMDTALTAAFAQIKTPFYFYDVDLLNDTLRQFTSLSTKYNLCAHYAIKANAQPRVLKIISSYGIGLECASYNELSLGIKCGFSADNAVFAGVGKTDFEIESAIADGIFCFNCESVQEIENINSIAEKMGKKVNISVRINPDIDAHTHKYITTGLEENKFGISPWEFESLVNVIKRCSNLNFAGLHFHVGSQITEHGVYSMLAKRASDIYRWFAQQGLQSANLDLGGGFGIDYQNPDANPVPNFEMFFKEIRENLDVPEQVRVHVEPGRSLVAQCGSLIARVVYVKHGRKKSFVILDAGMNDLIRPALYGAYHEIDNLTSRGEDKVYDVVGPVCESSDVWQQDCHLPETMRGDLIALRSAGAYGQVMAMRYNQRPLAMDYYSDELFIK